MSLVKIIKSLWSKDPQEAPILLPLDSHATFALTVDGLKIGILESKDGFWHFQYTSEFKESKKHYYPIVGFPDLDRFYKSETLWPFFLIRIPGLKQPAVQEVLRKENISADNEVALLKRFGRKSIANPYELVFST